jgi:thymidylate synthase
LKRNETKREVKQAKTEAWETPARKKKRMSGKIQNVFGTQWKP